MQTPWRDSFCVSEWAHESPEHKTIIVYCMYGFWVSKQVVQQLRDLDFDARSLNGGICAWRAMGYPSTSITT
jgi:Fe-Mn family superoxide dismutase